ncbi:MAG: BON domain-containing protein [Deltaproteobacteria bacterium]|nr:BON domain-containing protein [Deltaproteobacteria bacterium]
MKAKLKKCAIGGITLSFLLGLSLASAPTLAQVLKTPETKPTEKTMPPPGPKTEYQKPGAASDQDLSQNIRQSINSDITLSNMAKDVKVNANNGIVTLSGAVQNQHEKEVIENKAKNIAGQDKVKSQLQVASQQQKPANQDPSKQKPSSLQ